MKESRSLSSRLSSAQKHLIHALIQAAHNLSSTLLLGHEIPHFSLNFGLSATQTILIFSFRKFFINNYLGYPAVYSGFLLSALSLCISVSSLYLFISPKPNLKSVCLPACWPACTPPPPSLSLFSPTQIKFKKWFAVAAANA
jgi:hypothetical protein